MHREDTKSYHRYSVLYYSGMENETPSVIGALSSTTLYYLVVTLSVVLLLKYLFMSSLPANIPPFPARAYPILGHLPYLKKGTREPLSKWMKSAGNIFSLYFGNQLVVILSSYDVVYNAFVKNGDTFNDRPASLSSNAVGERPNLGIVTNSGKSWKEQRTVSLHILRSFGLGKNVLALKVNEEVSAYMHALSKLSGQPTNARIITRNAVANVICSIIVGKRFEYDDDYFISFTTKMEVLARLTETSSLFSLFPWLRFIPGDLFKAKKRQACYQYVKEFFCHHYIEKTKNEDNELNGENFISAYLQEKRKLETQDKENDLAEDHLSRIIFQLFVAGTDTTSTAIQWFMVYMLHYPDIQAKIFSEISEEVGLERAPDMHDKTKLNFLNATILETQRITIGPVSLPHSTSADTVINGYTIPAGTTVIANMDSILLTADTWEDPLKFKPERFLDAQGKLTVPDQLIPFGIGRRACIGEALARVELFLFLSSMIQRFELHPEVPGQLPSLQPVLGLVFSPQQFQIRFVDRRSS